MSLTSLSIFSVINLRKDDRFPLLEEHPGHIDVRSETLLNVTTLVSIILSMVHNCWMIPASLVTNNNWKMKTKGDDGLSPGRSCSSKIVDRLLCAQGQIYDNFL